MSDCDDVISTSPTPRPQRARAPPSHFQVVRSSDWNSASAVLVDGVTEDEWRSWWLTTPWCHQHLSKKNILWTQSKKTSNIWQYFQPCARSTDGHPFIRCVRCTSVLKHPAISNSGTTALTRHLETKACQKESKRLGNGSITTFLEPEKAVKARQFIENIGPWSSEAFYDQTLRVVGSLNLSFRSLDHPDLLHWLELVRKAPRNVNIHIIPSRKIRKYLQDHIGDGRSRMLQKIPADAKIAIALDCWTSPNHKSFLAVTGYFIDHAWEYQEVLLGFEHIEGQHSGQNLAQYVQNILQDCDLDLRRIITLTADNASNNITLTAALEQALNIINQDANQAGITRLPCLAHVIQLTCKELLVGIKIQAKNDRIIIAWDDNEERREQHTENVEGEGAPATLKKIRNAVIYINASTQRREKFHHVQHHRPLNLIQDVATRWNSTLKMMLRARKLKDALAKYAAEYPTDKLPTFTPHEWRHIDYLIEILYPFYRYTNAVSKIKNSPTVHNVYAIYNRLFDHLDDYITKLERKRISWKKQIRYSLRQSYEKLKKYYSDTYDTVGDIYAIATILGPRWKLDIFNSDAWKEDDKDYASDYLRLLHRVYSEYQARRFPEERALIAMRSSSPVSEAASSQTENLFSDISLSSIRTPTPGQGRRLKRKNTDDLNSLLVDARKAKRKLTTHEIDRYLTDNENLGIDFEDNTPYHTLRFWKRADTRKHYPVLAAIARDYLAIPAAGVGVERLFNTARDICSYRRHRLLPTTIRQLMMAICYNRFDQRVQPEESHNEDEESDQDDFGDEALSDDELECDDGPVQGLISDEDEDEDEDNNNDEDEDGQDSHNLSIEEEELDLPPLQNVSVLRQRATRAKQKSRRFDNSGLSRKRYLLGQRDAIVPRLVQSQIE